MAATASRSPARPEPARQRLTSPLQLVGIAIVIAVTLILIFPGRGVLTNRTATQQQPDAVAISYLRGMVRQEPKNPELRFTLAQKHTEIGQIAEARAALEPLYNSPDPAVRQRARLLDFRLQMEQMQAMKPRSQEREREIERLRQELAAMAQYEWNVAGLLDLAKFAGQLEARKLRAELYLRIARTETVSRQWLDEAAGTVLADSEYETAAQIYFTAQARAQSLEDQRHYFTSGVKALQAGNMLREAMAAAERNMGPLASDDETLKFVIKLARMANDMPRAQRYTKRLMRMSQEDLFRRWAELALSALVPSAIAAEADPRGTAKVTMRPYDAENYLLAYDVFVGAANLEDAYRVASAAVQQVPGDMGWRQRLAQVSEWSNRPQEAMEHWLYIARRTGRPAAWQAVMRLGPGLFADEGLLEALQWQAARGAPLTDEQWRAVVDAYERVGRPREGVALLEREYRRRPQPILLELQASLYERMGDLDAAIAANRRVIATAGATTPRITNLATLLLARGEYKAAYDLVQSYRGKVSEQDADYWRLLADLALALQQDKDATLALETLVRSGKAEPDDFARLITLFEPTQPVAAARLAELGYEKFKTPDFLVLALSIHAGRADFIAMRRLLAALPPETEKNLERIPEFLAARAAYRAGTGSLELAHADYRAAVQLAPANANIRITFLFFLIDHRFHARLRQELAARPEIHKDPAFDGVLGAAWLALDEPARAIAHYQRQLRQDPTDYLWLLSYADALEQNNEPTMAWRVRRHAWTIVRVEMQRQKARPSPELMQAHARLAIQNNPGDPSYAVIRELLRADGGDTTGSTDPNRRGLHAGTRDLVLAWAITSEQLVAAKAWLWKQYGKNISRPTWAETGLLLQGNEVEAAADILERRPDAIPRYDRNQAARVTQQHRLAQDIAFIGLERQPNDDEMHLRLTQSVLDMHNSVEVGYSYFRRGPIEGRETIGEIAVWLSPRLRLSADVSYLDQHVIDASALAFVPGRDRTVGVTALWRNMIGETRFTVFQRESLSDTTGVRLSHTRPLGPRMSGRVGLAYNERTLETAALAAGGVRDRAYIGGEYIFSKREYLSSELSASRYYTQDRTRIGSGESLTWELGHRFRTEYPDWHVRAAGSINRFSRDGSGDELTRVLTPDGSIPTPDFFLPPNFSVYGLYTGFGTFYQTNYTRALRPFVDVGVTHNTVTGNGYSALAGVSGSVFGADRLTFYASTGRGGTAGGGNELSREVGLRYMYMFDRF